MEAKNRRLTQALEQIFREPNALLIVGDFNNSGIEWDTRSCAHNATKDMFTRELKNSDLTQRERKHKI